MLRCPVCGSARLVWDHMSGYIVCSRCGAVVDVIIYDGPSRVDYENTITHATSDWASFKQNGYREGGRSLIASPQPSSGVEEVAVSVYMAALRAGMPTRKALRLASKASGLKSRSIRRALAKYKA